MFLFTIAVIGLLLAMVSAPLAWILMAIRDTRAKEASEPLRPTIGDHPLPRRRYA